MFMDNVLIPNAERVYSGADTDKETLEIAFAMVTPLGYNLRYTSMLL